MNLSIRKKKKKIKVHKEVLALKGIYARYPLAPPYLKINTDGSFKLGVSGMGEIIWDRAAIVAKL